MITGEQLAEALAMILEVAPSIDDDEDDVAAAALDLQHDLKADGIQIEDASRFEHLGILGDEPGIVITLETGERFQLPIVQLESRR